MTKRASFTQSHVARFVRGLRDAGWEDAVVEVIYGADGKAEKLTARRSDPKAAQVQHSEQPNEWDTVQ